MRIALALGLVIILHAAAAYPQAVPAAQVVSGPLQIPQGAAAHGFDIRRLNSENYGAFVPFYVTDSELLSAALTDGRVAADTPVLVIRTAGGRLALLTDQMAYHHLAQGRAGGKDWLATF
jgi:hypothetical protein